MLNSKHLKYPRLKSQLGLGEHKQFLIAAARSDKSAVESWINKGVNVNYSNSHGETALYLVSGTGNLDCVKMLVGYGADCTLITKSKQTVLHNAAHAGNEKLLEYYRNLGLDQIDFESWDGSTELILAARNGQTKAVAYLIDHGADVNYRDQTGLTALHYTVRHGHFECLRHLCDRGAKLNVMSMMEGQRGECALHCAMREKLTRAISILLQYGAKISCCASCKRGKPCSLVSDQILERVRVEIDMRKKTKKVLSLTLGFSLKEEKKAKESNSQKSFLCKIFRRKRELT